MEKADTEIKSDIVGHVDHEGVEKRIVVDDLSTELIGVTGTAFTSLLNATHDSLIKEQLADPMLESLFEQVASEETLAKLSTRLLARLYKLLFRVSCGKSVSQ